MIGTLEPLDHRALWRYVPNGPPDANGTIQFICPQCAGHVRFAANTRMGKYRRGNHPGLSLGPPFAQQWCCDGSISIRVEDLNQWQPVPWGTRAHKELYAAGRNRIENTNGIAKDGGGVSKKSCRAPGVPAHNMTAFASQSSATSSSPMKTPSQILPPTTSPRPICHCSA